MIRVEASLLGILKFLVEIEIYIYDRIEVGINLESYISS